MSLGVATRFVCTDVAFLCPMTRRSRRLDAEEGGDNVQRLKEMGTVPSCDVDLFNVRRFWGPRPEPAVVFVSGLARMYAQSQAADTIVSQFPDSLYIFLQHTTNQRWPCRDCWRHAQAYLR